MALMSSGGGLSNRKLELATAVPEDVIAGKTFYSGDKEIKSGVIPDYGYDPLAKSVGTYNPGDGNRVYLYLQNADTDQQDVGGHVTRSICAKSSDVLNALYSGNIIKSGAGLYWTYSVGYEHQVNTSVTIPAGQGYRTVIINMVPNSSKWNAPKISSGSLLGPYDIFMNGAAAGGSPNYMSQGRTYIVNNATFPLTIRFTTTNWDWRWGIQVYVA